MHRPAEHSVFLGRAQLDMGLRLPIDLHAALFGPPRSGKTGLLADAILHYPGPVLSTTTKHDVFQLTSGIRSRLGSVHVFNPQHIGGVPSTFRWNPIEGCRDPQVAIRRADAFANSVSLSGVDDGSFWSAKASSWLRAFFHAAALADADMRLVSRWVSSDARDAEDILRDHGAYQWAIELAEMRSEAAKTTATVRMVITRSLQFCQDPALLASVLPGEGCGFDIADFLATQGTLYLIADAEGEEAPIAPLFACLAGEVHFTAELIGQASSAGRLDPPLLMGLDEVTQICPVPLPSWLSDSGGKGIQVITCAHGEAQLAGRWGRYGARVVMDTSSAKLFFPGVTDPDTLQMVAQLAGKVMLKGPGEDDKHSEFDVVTPAMLRQLVSGRALIVRDNLAPTVVKVAAAWRDRGYRKARRAGTAAAAITAAQAAPAPFPVPTPTGTGNAHHRRAPDLAAMDEAEPVSQGTEMAGDGAAHPWRAR
jgi:type IV secretory pathway TraG/TraD family ATPase VirD4